VEPNGNLKLLKNGSLLTFEMSSVINVMLGEYSVKNVVQELARCLAIFPNLHTLKLNHTQVAIALCPAIHFGFHRFKSFPQIRSSLFRKTVILCWNIFLVRGASAS